MQQTESSWDSLKLKTRKERKFCALTYICIHLSKTSPQYYSK